MKHVHSTQTVGCPGGVACTAPPMFHSKSPTTVVDMYVVQGFGEGGKEGFFHPRGRLEQEWIQYRRGPGGKTGSAFLALLEAFLRPHAASAHLRKALGHNRETSSVMSGNSGLASVAGSEATVC